MKRSSKISLVLLVAPIITACGDNQRQENYQQDTYASKEQCKNDWDEEHCSPSPGGGTYLGPTYFFHHATNTSYMVDSSGTARAIAGSYPGRSSISTGSVSNPVTVAHASTSGRTSSISRGGFGSSGGSGRAVSSGG